MLKYRGALASLTGKPGEEVGASGVGDVLEHIKNQYGARAYKEAKRMLIAVDGTSILLLDRYKTPLSAGQTVTFLPMSAGG